MTSAEDMDAAIADIEKKIISYCNLVPVNFWGFDEDVREKLRQRKHRMLNKKLSTKEKQRLPSSKKQQLARGIGAVPSTVVEVLDWMSKSGFAKVQPTNPANIPNPKTKASASSNSEPPAKKPKTEVTKKVEPVDKTKDGEESEDDSSDDEADATSSESTKKTVKKEAPEESGDEQEDDDTTDEEDVEEEKVEIEKKPKVPVQQKAEVKIPKSDLKLDREIERLEKEDAGKGDDPELKRQIAQLKLQKKLKEMKLSRKGTSKTKMTPATAAKLEEERKMKRRLSKMKMKQRRAEAKKAANGEKPVKGETNETADEAKENGDTDGEKLNVAFNKFQFEIKDDLKGKKKRTPKSERALKLSGKDYTALIKKVEKTNAVIDKVREADPHKAEIMEDELKWEKTLKRASGVKVKDNVEMLKRAQHKKEKLKDRKKAKWGQREERVEKEKATKKEKRDSNIQKRKDDAKKRKLAKMRKKGRIL
ncbi:unnamed protein product [Caenorhabditis auriculariae]|uniref:Ribosomal RNA-processing protein 14/surfeit locus protein 6 C-terminal domain-containing protein n=1 Tax=Caenorhabditis auriculariae TaxID=2777116 RepID=A0A8S1HHE3_9PELO|nr:unnamed protein product [Caenorhabditis auriculariae]